MYRLKEIQDSLIKLVGWQQSFTTFNKINEDLTKSESGLYFQAAHPLLTLENIASIMQEDLFINDNKESNLSLSNYIKIATLNSISTVIQKFFTYKSINNLSKTLLENKALFNVAGRLSSTVKNRNRNVGFIIEPKNSSGLSIKIEKIALQFSRPIGKISLFVCQSGEIKPHKEIELTYNSENGAVEWHNIEELYLPSKGLYSAWYLYYNQSDLPIGAEAITVNKDWSSNPCFSCGGTDPALHKEFSKYMRIVPFCSLSENTENGLDPNKIARTNSTNYGLNLQLSVGCDLTDFIISQRALFASVIQKQVAYDLLRTMAMNPSVRVNRNQFNVSKMDILYELDGNTNGYRPNGLGNELENLYKALNLDTSGLDKICLPCSTKGVIYRTV